VRKATIKVGGGAKYYYLEEHQNEPADLISSPMLKNLGSTDMSDGNVLKAFIKFVLDEKAYEAKHYMLVIADHGGGWRGVCWDEIQDPDGGACITIPELRSALASSGHKFDIIAFDCCLMGMVEVAYEISNYADYMISSQNVTWATVDLGYEEWVPALAADPKTEPEQLAENIATAIFNVGNNASKPVCTSVIDLSKMASLGSKMGDLLTYLLVSTYGDGIVAARLACHMEEDALDAIDLKEFAQKLKQQPDVSAVPVLSNATQALVDAVSEAVPFKENNVEYARNGLSLYFPIYAQHYTEDDADNYSDLLFPQHTGWHNFIASFMDIGPSNTGTLQINSNPQGATVSVNGTEFGQTPMTITNVPEGDYLVQLSLTGYQPWQQSVHVTADQTTQVNATLTPTGGGPATVSGRVTWPGHSLTANTVAFLDSSHTEYIWPVAMEYVNPSTGQYTLSIDLDGPMEVWIGAWDDANYSEDLDYGDGLGFYDYYNMTVLEPGQQLTGVNITLQTLTGQAASVGRTRMRKAMTP
jgi:hypothetical protein